MIRDPVSESVIRLLRDSHASARSSWPNFSTITTAAQYRLLHSLCRKRIPAGGSVLDWGAGTGHASIYLSRAGFSVTGYSFDGFSFQDLLGDSPYRFVAGNASEPIRLPFDERIFDAVLSVGVLEHVRETGGEELASLREIRRVLRPGGVMICVHLPNAASWIDAFARATGRKSHTYRYTSAEVHRMFGATGFQVEEAGRYGALPRNQIARVLPRWLCDSVAFSNFYGAADWLGAALLPWFVQNHYVVATVPRSARNPAQSNPESQA